MAYTVKEVAAMAGVSVRTLHYYDEIGLLRPAYVGENGYRYYEEAQLLRLQQIMFFREFGIPLADIGRILNSPTFDPIEALEAHRTKLSQEADRIRRLLQTLNHTIEKLKGERDMSNQELYEGFDMEKQKEYEEEVKARWGEDNPLVQESLRRTANWTEKDYAEAKRRMEDLHNRMKEVFESGVAADSPAMQALIDEHYREICRYYTPTKEVYRGLGQMYVEDPRFRQNYDKLREGLAEYVRDAMSVYAEREL
jgi:DNA-binding transcriptional MerR regulator